MVLAQCQAVIKCLQEKKLKRERKEKIGKEGGNEGREDEKEVGRGKEKGKGVKRERGTGKEKKGEKLRSSMRKYFVNVMWPHDYKEPYSFSPGKR